MISKNKCHICLEDIINIPGRNKKSCCSTKAYICNNCWDSLLENEDTTECPICRENLPMIEDIESQETFEITNPQVIEIRNGRNPSLLTDSAQLECNTLVTILGLLFLFTLEGFIVFNICLAAFSGDSLEEQNEALMEIMTYPLSWVMQLFVGVITTILSSFIYYNCCQCFH